MRDLTPPYPSIIAELGYEEFRPSSDIGHVKIPASKLPPIVDGTPLLGTWKLKSYVVTTATGVRSTPYGENPTGYLSYSADGRVQVIGAANGRIVPAGRTATDNERVALHDTMFAYAGTYSVEAGKVIHHVDISLERSLDWYRSSSTL